jgi:hypothetical protein
MARSARIRLMLLACAAAGLAAVATPVATTAASCAPPGVGDHTADTLLGDATADCLDGRGGADVLRGRGGADDIDGGDGDDHIHGGRGADDIDGGDGDDHIVAGEYRDVVDAGDGDDTILVRDETRDVVDCGRGRDVVIGDREDRLLNCERPKLGAASDLSGKAAAANFVLQQLADVAPDNQWGRMVRSIAGMVGGDRAELIAMREMQVQLQRMQQQLYTLQADVQQINADLLDTHLDTLARGFAGPFVSDVTEAQRRLADVTDPDSRVSRTARVNAFKTWMKNTRLEFRLNQFEDLVDKPGGIIDAASKVARSRDSFFVRYYHTWEARAVYDYYALIQANALTVIVEYWHLTQGENAYYPYNEEAYIDKFKADHARRILDQARRLKPPLPPLTNLQKRTGILWRFAGSGYTGRYAMGYGRPETLANSPRVSNVSYAGRVFEFRLPSFADFDELVRDGVGAGPGQWLNQHGFPAYLFSETFSGQPVDQRFWANVPVADGSGMSRTIPWRDQGWGWPEYVGTGAAFPGLWQLKVNVNDYYY